MLKVAACLSLEDFIDLRVLNVSLLMVCSCPFCVEYSKAVVPRIKDFRSRRRPF